MTEPATRTETKDESSRPATPQGVPEERIRIRAYELYEKRKGEGGDAESDWYRAEAEIQGEGVAPAK